MRKIRFWVMVAVFMFCTSIWSISVFAEREYLVKFDTNVNVFSLAGDENANLEPAVPEWNLYRTDEETAKALQSVPGVAYVEPILPVEFAETVPPVLPDDPQFSSQWNLDMVGMPEAWYWGFAGDNVRVAVIDSGVNAEHEDLKSRVVAQENFSHSDTSVSDPSLIDPNNVADKNGHGTMVAGIVAAQTGNHAGIAGISNADLVSLKVVDGKNGSTLYMIRAIKAAVDKYHCDVINMSLTFNSYLSSVKEAIDYALSKGVIVVAANGNTSSTVTDENGNINFVRYPAGYPGVIGVGSVDKTKKHYSSSAANESVDVCAPGRSVSSTVLSGGYGTNTGTSFASPHVAGAAALLKGILPKLTGEQFQVLIQETSSDLGTAGWDEKYGYGLLNIPGMIWSAAPQSGLKVIASQVVHEADNLSIQYKNVSNTPVEIVQIWNLYEGTEKLIYVLSAGEQKLEGNAVLTADFPVSLTRTQMAQSTLWNGFQDLCPLLPKIKISGS